MTRVRVKCGQHVLPKPEPAERRWLVRSLRFDRAWSYAIAHGQQPPAPSREERRRAGEEGRPTEGIVRELVGEEWGASLDQLAAAEQERPPPGR